MLRQDDEQTTQPEKRLSKIIKSIHFFHPTSEAIVCKSLLLQISCYALFQETKNQNCVNVYKNLSFWPKLLRPVMKCKVIDCPS